MEEHERVEDENQIARRMHPDVAYLLKVVQDRDDTITALRGDVQGIPDKIGDAVQEALIRVASSPAVWAAAGSALREHARSQAGGWLLSGIRSVATKIAWLMLAIGAIYMIGGWAALAAVWKAALASKN